MLAFVATRIDASFLQGLCVCLEEGYNYNIVAAHTQKPTPPYSSHCRQLHRNQPDSTGITRIYLILKVGETPLYFFLTFYIVSFRKKKEDISDNLCLSDQKSSLFTIIIST